jgi:YebC/PmpR family DNA-binding regulatory protein
LVEVMTDNRNRTVAEVRHAFAKRGGNLGTDGSVAYLFARKGQIIFEAGASEDQVMEVALDAGADDVITHDDGSIEVLTPWEIVGKVKDAMVKAGLKPVSAEITMITSVQAPLDKDGAETVLGLIDALEDLDDVQNVYTNADISQEVMEQLNA